MRALVAGGGWRSGSALPLPQREAKEDMKRDALAKPMSRKNVRDAGGVAEGRAELVLLTPDDAVSHLLVEALGSAHSLRVISSTAAMRASLAQQGADLIILDQGSRLEEDVMQLCRTIRFTSTVAIIILVGSDDPEDRALALEAGADDTFSRTPDLRELKARISGILRRAAFGAGVLSRGRCLRFAGWSIDPHLRLLTDPRRRNVELTAAEFDLLWAFCRNSGRTLSRRTLLSLTRVGTARPMERSIDVHVNRLRRKIEDDPHRPVLLRTVRLGGYVFTPQVQADLSPEQEAR